MNARKLAALVAAATTIALAAGAALAGATSTQGTRASAGTLTVYSGREQEVVEDLFKQFEKATGIDVSIRYGESAELAATLDEEGGSSPADVFFAQDAGSLGAAALAGRLAPLPASILDKVAPRFRDPAGRWVGTSGRARVIVYNTKLVKPADLPASVFDLTKPRWKGKVGFPPTNASFQAFVTAMRLTAGEARTAAWLKALKANKPRTYDKNLSVVEAVAAGEIQVGLVNHYYLYIVNGEQPGAPIANLFLKGGDPGALVNVAGAGIVTGARHTAEAKRFLAYLLSPAGQRYYNTAEEAEFPIVAGIKPRAGLPTLASIQGPNIALGVLGKELQKTLALLSEAGFIS